MLSTITCENSGGASLPPPQDLRRSSATTTGHVSAEALAKMEAAPPRLAGKRAVAVVYSSYPSDPRPRMAAEALAKEGASVEVICLKETEEQLKHESFNGVDITRVPIKLAAVESFRILETASTSLKSQGAPMKLAQPHQVRSSWKPMQVANGTTVHA